jgi:glycosyltransferase involved in cell wall biosynthesis
MPGVDLDYSQKVSIIINNYNYERFLNEAIDSALSQSCPNIEVIVVDDGSTDGSREIIAGYGKKIIPVLKENGGMGSTFNAGFKASGGEIVLFLDSDDVLHNTAAEKARRLFGNKDTAKAHWSLWEIDEKGRKTGGVIPHQVLAEGNLLEAVIERGPDAYLSPPTSGNAWSRRFLEAVLPMPEPEFRQHADAYLFALAPLFGLVKTIPEPQAYYRIHGNNDYACKPTDEKNRRNLAVYEHRCRALSRFLTGKDIQINPEEWKKSGSPYHWMKTVYLAGEELKSIIAEKETFILVDDNQLDSQGASGNFLTGRRSFPFLEKDGKYWGPPPDDETAVTELERLRASGAKFIVFAWNSFWWLDCYKEFGRHLRSNYQSVLENERLVVFAL